MANGVTINTTVNEGGSITSTFQTGSTIKSTISAGGIGPQGPTGPQGIQGIQGIQGVQGNPGSVKGYFDVTDYGAVGDGTTDCTTAFQQAISAAQLASGGIVFVPSGTYVISDQLFLGTGISVLGQGSEASIIKQITTTKDCLAAIDAASIGLHGILLQGPGSGTGVGINFSWVNAGNVPFLNFTDVKVHSFGADNIYIETPIVSSFQNVVSQGSGGWGFNWYHAGTSCDFSACWARDNGVGGYRFFESVYQSLHGCASDGNPINYLIDSASGISFSGCGSESSPVGVKVTASSAIGFHNCWNFDNQGVAYWVTGSSAGVEFYACQEAGPNASATACFKYDTGCRGMLSSPGAVTANDLSAGVVSVIDDINGLATLPLLAVTGIADFYGNSINIHGTSGKLLISSNPDGGAYNVFVDTTGVLAFYGSATESLNLELLDGYLQLDTLTATTVPYMDASKRFVSSAVTPTELGYLSGATSSIQTQLGTKQGTITLTTTGTSGAATLIGGTLNIPQYSGGGGMTNPMTTAGDIIYGGTAGAPTRLAIGSATSILMGGSTVPVWTAATGTGTPVLATSPTLVAPALGVATATSLNKVTITAPGTSATLTLITGSSLITAGAFALTLTSTATTNATLPAGTHTLAGLDVAQTFTAVQTGNLWIQTPQAITVTTNAGTADISHGVQKFTNSSAAAMTITLTTTSAVDGQTKIIQVRDFSAVAEGITWVNTENSTISAPTTSNGSTTLPLTVGFVYNGSTSKWRCIAVA